MQGAMWLGGATVALGTSVERELRRGCGRGRVRGNARALGVLFFLAAAARASAADLPEACEAKDPTANKPFDFHMSAEIQSDYIFRGVTLSAHQPSPDLSIEVDRGPFYFKFEPYGVNLPTKPFAELNFSGGWCKKVLDKITLDVGLTYYYYLGEVPLGPVTSTSYGETHATLSYDTSDYLTLAATVAYSPNYSNSGAWERYVEGGFEIHMDKVFPSLLPKTVEWRISGTLGRSRFGTQSPDLGGFPLPAYTNWSLGLTFEFDPFTLELTYSNTNLTKENCFVFTGDPGAVPGGVIDPITNPLGLRSNWCGAAFVGTFSYEFSAGK